MADFIKCIKEHPCLWDTNSPLYKNMKLKEDAWKQITVEYGLADVYESKRLWKKLRDGHRQAIRRKTLQGDAGQANKWKYENLMEFLIPNMHIRTETVNVRYSSEGSQQNEEYLESEDDQDQSDDSSMIVEEKDPKLITIVNNKDKEHEETINERDPLKIRLEPITQHVKTEPIERSALEKFFMSMFETTSTLPERLQLQVQRKLFGAVMEAREEHLKISGKYHSVPSNQQNYIESNTTDDN